MDTKSAANFKDKLLCVHLLVVPEISLRWFATDLCHLWVQLDCMLSYTEQRHYCRNLAVSILDYGHLLLPHIFVHKYVTDYKMATT